MDIHGNNVNTDTWGKLDIGKTTEGTVSHNMGWMCTYRPKRYGTA
jgi:hypothetical protein